MIFLFARQVVMIFDTEVVQEVPGWQEGDPQEETEGPAQLWDEGDGGEGPDLPLYPHLGRGEAVEDWEVTAQTERGEFILFPLYRPVSVIAFMNWWSRSTQRLPFQFVFLGKII